MLVIHPDQCIDCGVCEPKCPVSAIRPDSDSVAASFLDLNLKYAELWPNITRKKAGPPDADQWRDVPNKLRDHFSPNPPSGHAV